MCGKWRHQTAPMFWLGISCCALVMSEVWNSVYRQPNKTGVPLVLLSPHRQSEDRTSNKHSTAPFHILDKYLLMVFLNIWRYRFRVADTSGRRGSVADRLLRLRVRILPWALMSVSCESCVLSGRFLCVGLITCPEGPTDSGVSECDREDPIMRRPCPTKRCCAMVGKNIFRVIERVAKWTNNNKNILPHTLEYSNILLLV